IRISIEEATVGSVALPQALLTQLTETINDALATAQIDVEITEVQIREGEIVIAGHK
ncbi:MAG: hypothetical protein GX605_05490, partial [Chloroflexi bacterium]|nr:hypothetical protein [Chloroflexota bacterium]